MENMRDLLRGSLGRSLKGISEHDRLLAAWSVACGSAMAAHGELLGLDDQGVLHVRVREAAWLPQFVGLRTALSLEVGRIAGVPLKAIHFQQEQTKWDKAGARV